MPWMTLEYKVTMRFIADIEYAKVIHRITFCYRLQISNRLPAKMPTQQTKIILNKSSASFHVPSGLPAGPRLLGILRVADHEISKDSVSQQSTPPIYSQWLR